MRVVIEKEIQGHEEKNILATSDLMLNKVLDKIKKITDIENSRMLKY